MWCRDFFDIAKLLIEKGANVNIGDDSGKTPLIMSIIFNKKSHAELLLQHGADKNLKNGNGESALDIAKMKQLTHFYDILN